MYNNNLCLWILILIIIGLLLWWVFQPKIMIIKPVEGMKDVDDDVDYEEY